MYIVKICKNLLAKFSTFNNYLSYLFSYHYFVIIFFTNMIWEDLFMDLQWMQNHRALVGKFIRFANAYTVMYNRPVSYGTPIPITAAQIQTLEYIMENEDMKMSDIAQKLGVTRSTFSKNANVLIRMGLLKKFRREDNHKDIYLFATDFGKNLYQQYTEFVYEHWYRHLFELAENVPGEYIEKFEEMLDWCTHMFIEAGQLERKKPTYIPLDEEGKP